MLTQELIGFAAGGAVPAVAFGGATGIGGGGPTYTATGIAIGAAAFDRYVAVVVAFRDTSGTPTISSVTVGGAATTSVIANTTTLSGITIYITDAPVTTGTTADVVVTMSEGVTLVSVATYALTGLTSSTAVETDTSTTDAASMTIGTAAAVGIAAAMVTAGSTFTATGVTEQHDTNTGGIVSFTSGMAAPAPSSVSFDAVTNTGFRQLSATWS
jgi:hypothetical protein